MTSTRAVFRLSWYFMWHKPQGASAHPEFSPEPRALGCVGSFFQVGLDDEKSPSEDEGRDAGKIWGQSVPGEGGGAPSAKGSVGRTRARQERAGAGRLDFRERGAGREVSLIA